MLLASSVAFYTRASSHAFIKNGFKKTNQVKRIEFDTKKEICLIEFISIQLHPTKMKKIVKDAGYELRSIKILGDKEPNRYNKP